MRCKCIFSSIAIITLLYPTLPVRADEYQYTEFQCSDIVGQQIQNDSGDFYQNDAGSRNSAEYESHQRAQSRSTQTGGEISYGLASAGGNHSFSHSLNTADVFASSTGRTWDEGYGGSHNRDTMRTEAVGRNCDSYNQAGAARDISRMNYELQRRRDSRELFRDVVGW